MQPTVIDQPANQAVQTVPAPEATASRPPARLRVSARFLLGIYAIVPLCLVAMVVDRFFWNGTLLRSLPTSPESFFIFQLLFGTPHIIASSVLLTANGNYLRTYWLRLVLFTLGVILFFALGSHFIPFDIFFQVSLALIGAVTVLHVIKQQVGIGKGICRLPSWTYELWGWTLIVFGSILYYPIYGGITYAPDTAAWVHPIMWGLEGLVVVMTLVCHVQIKTMKGKLYLWANALMVLQSGLFYFQGYMFLAIIGPRLVHDLTAFTFYVAHDVNRHGAGTHNLLYRLAAKLGCGVFWVCPALAVLLTYLIARYADPLFNPVAGQVLGFTPIYGASFLIIGYLGLLHYYTEAFTWRQGSPYRVHVALSS